MATSNFNPEASPATTAGDGYVNRAGNEEALATIIAGAGTGNNDSGSTTLARLRADDVAGTYDQCVRTSYSFDTSAIPDTDVISSAKLKLYGSEKTTNLGTTDIVIVESSPTDPSNLANGDYGNFGSTEFGSIAIASISTVAYNDFTLNASGIATINKTGVTSFGALLRWDFGVSTTGLTWSSTDLTEVQFLTADNVTNLPILEVVHAPASTRRIFIIS